MKNPTNSDKTDKNLFSSFNFISHTSAIVLFHFFPKFVVDEGATRRFRVPSSNAQIVIPLLDDLAKRLNDSTWWCVRSTNERARIRMRVTHRHPSKTCFTLVARNLDASRNTWLVIIICRTWHSSFRVTLDVHYIGVTRNWKFARSTFDVDMSKVVWGKGMDMFRC